METPTNPATLHTGETANAPVNETAHADTKDALSELLTSLRATKPTATVKTRIVVAPSARERAIVETLVSLSYKLTPEANKIRLTYADLSLGGAVLSEEGAHRLASLLTDEINASGRGRAEKPKPGSTYIRVTHTGPDAVIVRQDTYGQKLTVKDVDAGTIVIALSKVRDTK